MTGTRDEMYQDKAIGLVTEFIEENLDKSDARPQYEVYVVWFVKVLQNWKALLSSTLPDGMYYEVTYNGDEQETYVDAYRKLINVVVPD
jgi:hypothetical protein